MRPWQRRAQAWPELDCAPFVSCFCDPPSSSSSMALIASADPARHASMSGERPLGVSWGKEWRRGGRGVGGKRRHVRLCGSQGYHNQRGTASCRVLSSAPAAHQVWVGVCCQKLFNALARAGAAGVLQRCKATAVLAIDVLQIGRGVAEA